MSIIDAIQRLAKNNNISVTEIDDSGRVIAFSCSGFSKYGQMKCIINYNDDVINGESRYDSKYSFQSYNDFVYLAFFLWNSYRERGFSIPDEFKQDFIDLGLIKVKTVEVYEPAVGNR